MTQLPHRRGDAGAHPASKPRHSMLRRIKVRLQFTGWLQYLLTATAAIVFLVIAALGKLIGIWPVPLFWLLFGIGAALLAVAAFDVITVKLGLRPSEPVPGRRDDLDNFDLMRSRRSCRSFQSRNLSSAHREELVRAALERSHPDHVIGTSPIRLEYIAAPLTVWPMVGAHEFFVAIAPHDYDRLAIIDVGRSLQKLVLHATRMGVATCWIGPGADQTSIAKHLGDRFDPDQDHVVCVCAVGYRSRFEPLPVRVIELAQHRRLPLASLFFADPYFQRPLAVGTAPFSSFGRCYEVCQWSPSSFDSQTTRCVVAADDTGQTVTRVDFYAATQSRYYAPVALGVWCADWETGCKALGTTGHFQILTPGERKVSNVPELPRYDMSWLPDPDRSIHTGPARQMDKTS
jgi:nitroreductase